MQRLANEQLTATHHQSAYEQFMVMVLGPIGNLHEMFSLQ